MMKTVHKHLCIILLFLIASFIVFSVNSFLKPADILYEGEITSLDVINIILPKKSVLKDSIYSKKKSIIAPAIPSTISDPFKIVIFIYIVTNDLNNPSQNTAQIYKQYKY